MPELDFIYDLIGKILPFETMQARFMQEALLGLIILAPTAALMGVQMINFRMSFFADAISHSAFTGIAIGLFLGISPHLSTPIFATLLGIAIIAFLRKSFLSEDAIIGVFFSGVVAFGLAMVSREKTISRDIQRFLYGDILTIGNIEIWAMIILSILVFVFQFFSYNRLLYIGLSSVLASAHRVNEKIYQYIYFLLLSLVVIFLVWAVGVLLVTALLIVPAATARNLARSAGGMVWWALFLSIISAITGLIISAQDWVRTATGATIVLVSFIFFIMSQILNLLRKARLKN